MAGGVNTFGAILIRNNFGFSVTEAQLLNIPIGALVIILYFACAYSVKRTNEVRSFSLVIFLQTNN